MSETSGARSALRLVAAAMGAPAGIGRCIALVSLLAVLMAAASFKLAMPVVLGPGQRPTGKIA